VQPASTRHPPHAEALRTWTLRIAARRGKQVAVVTLALRLSLGVHQVGGVLAAPALWVTPSAEYTGIAGPTTVGCMGAKAATPRTCSGQAASRIHSSGSQGPTLLPRQQDLRHPINEPRRH